ncbi:MAG TPA: glycine cleavage system aminomethyltransferase GcvT [Candidatus Ruania gallistercoris]|uniref:Aminomethyltransferase n=1 Tax=Candidatus Ruania gallistercoris TaxID=2838746 RepID=A0A9D2EI02_9MICO|nr:glycine cleavage system aminomethyltransferase GcvT [Candidatus Ruania gallistercoris]
MTELSTPLYATHLDAGAVMTDFAAWQMPLRYTGDRAEHEAVRTGAGLFDLSHMAQIEVHGPQAAEALDMALVSAVSRLTPGRARYTMLVTAQGGILDDLIVYRLTEDEFLVIANAANRATVLDQLTVRSAAHQVGIVDRTTTRALIALQGPRAAEVLSALTDDDLSGLRYYASMSTEVAGIPVLLARTGYTGEDGFELSTSAVSAVDLWQALLAAGEEAGVIPCGLASRDSLRLEAGMPLYGNELTDQTTPYDVGMGRLVHLDRQFVGQEALAARAEQPEHGHLAGLRGEGRRAARAGYPVFLAGAQIGEITSGILSPTLGYPIALARLDRELAADTDVTVDVRGTPTPMTVTTTPFYRRPK